MPGYGPRTSVTADTMTLRKLFPLGLRTKTEYYQQFGLVFRLRHGHLQVSDFLDVIALVKKALVQYGMSGMRFKAHMNFLRRAVITLQRSWRRYRWKRDLLLEHVLYCWRERYRRPRASRALKRASSYASRKSTRGARRFSVELALAGGEMNICVQMEAIVMQYLKELKRFRRAVSRWVLREKQRVETKRKEAGDWLFFADETHDDMKGGLKKALAATSHTSHIEPFPAFNFSVGCVDFSKLHELARSLQRFYENERVLSSLEALASSSQHEIEHAPRRVPYGSLPVPVFQRYREVSHNDNGSAIVSKSRLLWTTNVDAYYAAAVYREEVEHGLPSPRRAPVRMKPLRRATRCPGTPPGTPLVKAKGVSFSQNPQIEDFLSYFAFALKDPPTPQYQPWTAQVLTAQEMEVPLAPALQECREVLPLRKKRVKGGGWCEGLGKVPASVVKGCRRKAVRMKRSVQQGGDEEEEEEAEVMSPAEVMKKIYEIDTKVDAMVTEGLRNIINATRSSLTDPPSIPNSKTMCDHTSQWGSDTITPITTPTNPTLQQGGRVKKPAREGQRPDAMTMLLRLGRCVDFPATVV